jgi:SAM-dependent methyltransferase
MKSIFESARFIRGSLLEVGSMVRARAKQGRRARRRRRRPALPRYGCGWRLGSQECRIVGKSQSVLMIRQGLGAFDYINCIGVLHHLETPSAGLAALTSVLKEDGGMNLMVYGELGRRGIYEFHDMYRLLGKQRNPDLARRLVCHNAPTQPAAG